MESKIVYCDKCGEYLGDRINGVLYKFGSVVTQPHICEKDTGISNHSVGLPFHELNWPNTQKW